MTWILCGTLATAEGRKASELIFILNEAGDLGARQFGNHTL